MMMNQNSVKIMSENKMNCPKCNNKINLLTSKSSEFLCDECGVKLAVRGGIIFHIFASVLFIVEAMFLFSLDIETWVLVLVISILAIFNYYLSSKLFLHAVVNTDG